MAYSSKMEYITKAAACHHTAPIFIKVTKNAFYTEEFKYW